jgi:hypothetical protein
VGLALSQITTAPDTVKTQFDRGRDQEQVAQFLRDGCTQMHKAFDIEDVNLDDLIATAMDDPQALAGDNKAFRGITSQIYRRPPGSFAEEKASARRSSTLEKSSIGARSESSRSGVRFTLCWTSPSRSQSVS